MQKQQQQKKKKKETALEEDLLWEWVGIPKSLLENSYFKHIQV